MEEIREALGKIAKEEKGQDATDNYAEHKASGRKYEPPKGKRGLIS